MSLDLRWANPFPEDAEEFSVELNVPWNWSGSRELIAEIEPHIPQGFTNVYDGGEADPSVPFWAYVPFSDFVAEGTLDTARFVTAISATFGKLLNIRSIIDGYLASSLPGKEFRAARRTLGKVAVVDTETIGDERELVEVSIILAAYDRDNGQIFGILDQYEGIREPACKVFEGGKFAIAELRGKTLEEQRMQQVLLAADFVVAHNKTFDRAVLTKMYDWAADLDWRCSLHQVGWTSPTKNLQDLLSWHHVDCGTAHRATSDAMALLELLSYCQNGKPYLKQLIASPALTDRGPLAPDADRDVQDRP